MRVTEIDVGIAYSYNEVDTPLSLLAISPIPGGGSRLAFMGSDSMVHIAQLDTSDNLVTGSTFGLSAFDFQDIYADATGGVVLVSRNAMGGGTLNCGNPSNLCGTPPNPAIPCYDMYAVRFNGSTEAWATKLTTSSASLPPYSTGKTGPAVYMIWWYAHNGRLAGDGAGHVAAYYGAAISVDDGSGCINIHQGDEMRILDSSGNTQSGGFDWGCSHSAFERMAWDGSKFIVVCNNDGPAGGKSGQTAFAPNITTIYPVDEVNTELGNVLPASGGGYWVAVTDLRSGQTAGNPGLDDVHLVHTTTGTADKDIVLASDSGLNDRNPHLAPFGSRMLAAWETSTVQAPGGGHLDQSDTSRKLYVQALSPSTGAALSTPYLVSGVTGSRYQDFRSYADGSVAYAAPGSSATKIKILRVLSCQ